MTQLLLPFLRIVFTLFPSWDFDDLRRITYPASTRPRKAQAGGNDVTANMRLLSSVASSVPATTKVLMSFTHFPNKVLDFHLTILFTFIGLWRDLIQGWGTLKKINEKLILL